MNENVTISGDGFAFAAHYSPWRRHWVGKCTCGATLKSIFRDRSCDLPLFFMKIHAEASHGTTAQPAQIDAEPGQGRENGAGVGKETGAAATTSVEGM